MRRTPAAARVSTIWSATVFAMNIPLPAVSPPNGERLQERKLAKLRMGPHILHDAPLEYGFDRRAEEGRACADYAACWGRGTIGRRRRELTGRELAGRAPNGRA